MYNCVTVYLGLIINVTICHTGTLDTSCTKGQQTVFTFLCADLVTTLNLFSNVWGALLMEGICGTSVEDSESTLLSFHVCDRCVIRWKTSHPEHPAAVKCTSLWDGLPCPYRITHLMWVHVDRWGGHSCWLLGTWTLDPKHLPVFWGLLCFNENDATQAHTSI